MPRVNVYLPAQLAEQAKNARLNVSAITQEAIAAALAKQATDTWLATLLQDPRIPASRTVTHQAMLDALDEGREEISRHG